MERGAYQSLVFTNAAMQSGARIVSKSSCQIVNVPTEDCKQTGSAFAKRGFTRRVRTLRRISGVDGVLLHLHNCIGG